MGWSLTMTTPPTGEPVDIVELKRHLRIEHGHDDPALLAYAQAARVQCEVARDEQFVEATFDLQLDSFWEADLCKDDVPGAIRIPAKPLVGISSVAYIDTAGDSQTLTVSTDYVVTTRGVYGTLAPAWGKTWPATREVKDAVTITLTAGWGNLAAWQATSVDPMPTLKLAIEQLTGFYYEHREESPYGMPRHVESLLGTNRVSTFG